MSEGSSEAASPRFLTFVRNDRNKNMKFTKTQHKTWSTLIQRQLPLVEKCACREFLEGLKILNPPTDRIPTVQELNERVRPRTGWKIVRTRTHYLDQVEWYTHTTRKEFPTTAYIRQWHELDFTPDPDMFHDIFGHIPFMAIKETAEILEMFARVFPLVKTPQQKKDIARLAWFSYEFGLIKEHGKIKMLGAGILSSFGEIQNIAAGNVPVRKFTIEAVLKKDKSLGSFNSELFVCDSLSHLKAELNRFFTSLKQP
jgi:phenylalanine-4-hydroxylase